MNAIDFPSDELTEEEVRDAEEILENRPWDREKVFLTTPLDQDESPPNTHQYILQADTNGIISVFPPTGAFEDPIAMFDASQLAKGPRRQALRHIDPKIRWAEYASPSDGDKQSLINPDLTDELDTDVPDKYNLTKEQPKPDGVYYPPDIDRDSVAIEELIATVEPLSKGDIVRFGGPIGKRVVKEAFRESSRDYFINFYSSSSTDQPGRHTDPAAGLTFSALNHTQHITNFVYGPEDSEEDQQLAISGIITDVNISKRESDEYNAELIADVEWELTPRLK